MRGEGQMFRLLLGIVLVQEFKGYRLPSNSHGFISTEQFAMFLVEGMDYDYGLEIMMVVACVQNMCRPGPAVLVLYLLNYLLSVNISRLSACVMNCNQIQYVNQLKMQCSTVVANSYNLVNHRNQALSIMSSQLIRTHSCEPHPAASSQTISVPPSVFCPQMLPDLCFEFFCFFSEPCLICKSFFVQLTLLNVFSLKVFLNSTLTLLSSFEETHLCQKSYFVCHLH